MRPTPVRLFADRSKGHLWPGQRSVPAMITGCSRSSSLFQMLMTSLSRMPPFGGSATNVNGSNSSCWEWWQLCCWSNAKMIKSNVQKIKLQTSHHAQCNLCFPMPAESAKVPDWEHRAGWFRSQASKKVVSGSLAYCMWSLPHVPYGCKDLGNPPSPHLTCPEPKAPWVAQLREGSIGEPGHGTVSKLENHNIYIYTDI